MLCDLRPVIHFTVAMRRCAVLCVLKVKIQVVYRNLSIYLVQLKCDKSRRRCLLILRSSYCDQQAGAGWQRWRTIQCT